MNPPAVEHAIVDDAGPRLPSLAGAPRRPASRPCSSAPLGTPGTSGNGFSRICSSSVGLGHGTTEQGEKSRFGQKYEVRGILEGPSGGRADVVTAWIVLDGEESPRFVTAFPGEAR